MHVTVFGTDNKFSKQYKSRYFLCHIQKIMCTRLCITTLFLLSKKCAQKSRDVKKDQEINRRGGGGVWLLRGL